MADVKQQELDFVEQQVLTDIFGGYTPDKFVYRYGFFKFDMSDKVQKAIAQFEQFMKPMMDEQGFVDMSQLKRHVNENIIRLPDGRYRVIDLYRHVQPFLVTLLNAMKG